MNDEDDHPIWSSIVKNTARPGKRGDIRRCPDMGVVNHPEMGVFGCRTLYEGIRRGAIMNPLGPCLGFRAVSTTGFATPYIFTSYNETLARINCFAAGLDALKLVEPNDDNMLLLGLYMKNCSEWVIAEHAIYTLGGATVPFYDTLGPDVVQYILTHTDTTCLVCTRAELERVCDAKKTGKCPKFKAAVVVDGVTPQAAQNAKAADIQAISFAKVEAVGAERIAKAKNPTEHHNPPSYDDLCTICYTSGTTGTPKGAMLTHGNIISAAAGTFRHGHNILEMNIYDRHISYLPLAHIFERVVQAGVLITGASIAFFRGDPTLLIEDIQACQPTMMPVAPRVLNKIYDKINNTVNMAGGMKKKLFDAAVAAKTEGLKNGHLKHAFYDRLIFNKIKKGLGMEHMRVMLSGSAPLSDDVMSFFRILLGVPVVEGYGQTEGAAAATIGYPDDISALGHVGSPTACTEIALYDVPEMGYLQTDTSHQGKPCRGRGEICVRGPNVFVGYYKDEEKTKEAIDDEGWLHSGDIGLWRLDGTLQIIDRKKNIFKLSQGEYVAPEKIENIIIGSPLIAQAFVYGDSLQSSLIAIIVPELEVAHQWAAANAPDLANASLDQLCENDALLDAVMADIAKYSKAGKLNGFEMVRAIKLTPTMFTVENDLLTPTFKLKRQKARDVYAKDIEKLYASLPLPKSKL